MVKQMNGIMKQAKQMKIRKEIDILAQCICTEIDYVATLNGHVGLLASRYNSETVCTHYVLTNDGNPFQLHSLVPRHCL